MNPYQPGLERIAPRPVKVGLVAGGLGAYWPQFPDLLPQLRSSARRVSERVRALGCEVADVSEGMGLSDRVAAAVPAAVRAVESAVTLLRAEDEARVGEV